MVDVSDLIGIKYTEHGRYKETGFDCYGLAIEVERRLGHILPDFDYITHTDALFNDSFRRTLLQGHLKKINTFVEGAIILFENGSGMKNHIAVYLGDGYAIHCNYSGVHLEKVETISQSKKEVYIWLK